MVKTESAGLFQHSILTLHHNDSNINKFKKIKFKKNERNQRVRKHAERGRKSPVLYKKFFLIFLLNISVTNKQKFSTRYTI